jgi:hypothetical protein
MNRFIVFSALCASASAAFAQTTYLDESVAATADIYRAGTADLSGDGGTAPDVFTLPTGPLVLSFSSVSGSITLNGGGGFNNPDGVTTSGGESGGGSSDTATGGLSGVTIPGQGALMGIFINATSASTVPTPGSLDFTGDTSFASLSPSLDQVFFIGDGLTGNGTGSIQNFDVPAGATELVLGITDAGGYNGSPGSFGDNSEDFTASFDVTSTATSSGVPDNSSSLGLSALALAALALVGAYFKKGSIKIA